MVRLLDIALEQLTSIIYRMGEVAEKAINISIRGFMNGKDVAGDVREISDMLNTMTVEVEDKAFELIVRYQPVASDLRIINSYMKIAYDFERYGRYAWDISFTHNRIAKLDTCISFPNLMERLAEKVVLMVDTSVRALKQHDTEGARNLADIENEVDKLYFEYLDRLAQDSALTKRIMCDLLVTRYLERIADHTTYVGESIVYIVDGEKVSLR